MEIFEAVLLGIVQGIAEFLPISSSGHIVICGELLDRCFGSTLADSKLQLNVALHVGTLFSILVVYRTEVTCLIHRPRLCLAIVLATIPAGLVGFCLEGWFNELFRSSLVAGCCLFVTAGLLLAAQKWDRNRHTLDELSLNGALTIGIFQAAALIPGISRSGSTIAGGLLTGLRRDAATTFSFFIAIPIIAGAALKDFVQPTSGTHPIVPMCVGALTAFLVGLFALRWLIKLVSQRKLHWFAFYCMAVATLTILWQVLERIGREHTGGFAGF